MHLAARPDVRVLACATDRCDARRRACLAESGDNAIGGTIELSVNGQLSCFEQVHPNWMDVHDFTAEGVIHPGNTCAIRAANLHPGAYGPALLVVRRSLDAGVGSWQARHQLHLSHRREERHFHPLPELSKSTI